MEGLIPMVYKSLKKNMTRKQYESLSSGAAQTYNIGDFYRKDGADHHYFSNQDYTIPGSEPEKIPGLRWTRHRRCNSAQVKGFASKDGAAKQKQLLRFRSHRMFSCVTGA
ncbi:hypothetical protein CDL12_27892 [Handroanthus impetiginosus]|uniref:Uncharacterized protein n=1 Tax=Handroanthus impetiginosus TaxID=429701 RepID=A0A2G9G2S7_9LAMI|nr:hypothetical protein CDL12_27892 [Handroanthus impetiginosus]